jgi:hypothetical protein
MSSYIQTPITLSDSQKDSIKSAFNKKQSVCLKFTVNQLNHGSDTLMLTQLQRNRIAKAIAANKGVQITLSKTQLTKQGGFLPFLLPLIAAAKAAIFPALAGVAKAAIPALATTAVSSLVNKNNGSGLVLPGTIPRGRGLGTRKTVSKKGNGRKKSSTTKRKRGK